MPLVGLAHGSRHAGVTGSVTALLAATGGHGAMPVATAFLDLAEPDLATVARGLAAAGHHEAVVAPLLFTEAFHARVDVPEAVREAAAASGLRLHTTDVLGTGDDMLAVVRAAVERDGVPDSAPVLLLSVGSSSASANDAVHGLAGRLADLRGTPVAAAFATADPRPAAVLDALGGSPAVVVLFLSPGLLLQPVARLAAERGLLMTGPLGELAAPLLLQRYRETLSRVADRSAGVGAGAVGGLR